VNQAQQAIKDIFQTFTPVTSSQKPFIKAFCFRTLTDISRIIHESNERIETVFNDGHYLWDRIYDFDTLPEIYERLNDMAAALCDHLHTKRTRKNANVIETIVHLLETRYQEPLTIDDIAKHIHLTPNYVSNIFKEHVGESVIDYLTKVRMKHA